MSVLNYHKKEERTLQNSGAHTSRVLREKKLEEIDRKNTADITGATESQVENIRGLHRLLELVQVQRNLGGHTSPDPGTGLKKLGKPDVDLIKEM